MITFYLTTFVRAMEERRHRYFVLNKPFGMVSQFVSVEDVRLLGDVDFDFPEGTHAVGRLDGLSEGVLLLTTNKRVTKWVFEGERPHKRRYLVRVLGKITEEKVEALRNGVTIRVRGSGDYVTAGCEVVLLPVPPQVPAHQLELNPYIAHSWLEMTLYEGKRHQVRNMVRAVGHECRRLIRTAIEDVELGELQPGEVRELDEETFFGMLKIDNWR